MDSQWNTDHDKPQPVNPFAQGASNQQGGQPAVPWASSGNANRRGAGKIIAIAVAVVAVVLIVALVVAMVAKGSDDAGGAAPAESGDAATESAKVEYPADGEHALRLDAANACATEGTEPGNDSREVTVLGDCGDIYPAMTFTQVGEGQYTIGMDFTEDDWQACLTVDEPADDDGYLLAGQDCEDGSPSQVFTLTPLDSGFAVMTSTDMCLEPLGSELEAGTPLATASCAGSASQRFTVLDGA
ncbi:MAG: RICIN domain-containing protein [Stackebrandtia sp.]